MIFNKVCLREEGLKDIKTVRSQKLFFQISCKAFIDILPEVFLPFLSSHSLFYFEQSYGVT